MKRLLIESMPGDVFNFAWSIAALISNSILLFGINRKDFKNQIYFFNGFFTILMDI
jgi:hypothetical protein